MYPEPLRELYSEYANGLSVADELIICGLVRGGGSIDPYPPQRDTVPADAAREYVFFGLLGAHDHALYVDRRDDRVHLSRLNSADPLRSGPTFASFLCEVVDEVLGLFDEHGEKLAELSLPEEIALGPPAPWRALQVAPAFQAALEQLLERLPARESELGELVLYAREDLGVRQVGFRIGPDGKTLDEWAASWVVLGHHKDLADPLIVDLADPTFPLHCAMTGTGFWDADPVDEPLP